MRKAGGIYEILNAANGKRYIGSAVCFSLRWNNHRVSLRRSKHHSAALQHAWNKYGEEAFVFRALLACAKEQLLFQEQRAIHGFMPAYNICKVAGSQLGAKRTPEQRVRYAGALRGQIRGPHSAEHRAKLSAAHTGQKRSPEQCARIGASKRGRKLTAEQRASMSAVRRGKSLTAEHRAKIAAARAGRKRAPFTTEARANMSTARVADWKKRKPPV